MYVPGPGIAPGTSGSLVRRDTDCDTRSGTPVLYMLISKQKTPCLPLWGDQPLL